MKTATRVSKTKFMATFRGTSTQSATLSDCMRPTLSWSTRARGGRSHSSVPMAHFMTSARGWRSRRRRWIWTTDFALDWSEMSAWCWTRCWVKLKVRTSVSWLSASPNSVTITNTYRNALNVPHATLCWSKSMHEPPTDSTDAIELQNAVWWGFENRIDG
ncbi:hypothetical protein H310_08094 [Aphanomyces invadans]|uniref:Uncharacterized protein n=1 Tax=Aphanomyces invadans TaxID=157072 RepID=A0A024U1D1_9STRA|nr:hypothetical protein H310_08094 [Aphanomyces invadans]ETV99387.1 hypothetical protein H310_08094 [Aphanomyces invadans]|eukprot:XP_008871943.1 hypothetical protein H310_08094 [Aphanomyces invadans]